MSSLVSEEHTFPLQYTKYKTFEFKTVSVWINI